MNHSKFMWPLVCIAFLALSTVLLCSRPAMGMKRGRESNTQQQKKEKEVTPDTENKGSEKEEEPPRKKQKVGFPALADPPAVFEGLPLEVWDYIFSFLTSKEQIDASLTCQLFSILGKRKLIENRLNDGGLSPSKLELLLRDPNSVTTSPGWMSRMISTGLKRLSQFLWNRDTLPLFWSQYETLPPFPTLSRRDYKDGIKKISLNSNYGDHITSGTLKLLALFPNLTKLYLNGCELVRDDGIIAIANGCPILKFVHLRNCHKMTDQGIQELARHCPELTCLMLFDAPYITDASLITLAQSCKELKKLYIDHCSNGNITDESVIAIAQNCPKLKRLEFNGCGKTTTDGGLYFSNITDRSFEELLSCCPNLQYLNLEVSSITGSSLIKLADNSDKLTNLTELNINCCPNVTKEAIRKLKQQRPLLKVYYSR